MRNVPGIYRGREVQVLETSGSLAYVKDGNRLLWVWTKQVELVQPNTQPASAAKR